MGQNAPQPMGASSEDVGSNSNPFLKLLSGGTQGLAQGFSNMQNQNSMMRQGGEGQMGPMPQAAPVSSDYFLPQKQQKPNNLAFYGGGQ